MILVGVNIDVMRHGGQYERFIEKRLFEADDLENAKLMMHFGRVTAINENISPVNGEFHDTETHRTWSVYGIGYTKRDYRYESENAFKKRWAYSKERIC